MTSTQLDHIVLLVDTPFFENLPEWVTKNFTVTPGGYHENQASRNKLVVFTDGTYLEFFNWYDTPPTSEDTHLPMRFWASKKPGLIDFAITDTMHSADVSITKVNEALSQGSDTDAGLGIRYGQPTAGSRKTADGVEIEWEVTRPDFTTGPNTPGPEFCVDGRIDVPFFCHDVTERRNRVPCQSENTTHPCGATGIAACEVLVPKHLLTDYAVVYSKIIGSDAKPRSKDRSYSFDIGVSRGHSRSLVIVRTAETKEEVQRMQERGIGLLKLVLSCGGDDREHGGRVPLDEAGIGSTIWLQR